MNFVEAGRLVELNTDGASGMSVPVLVNAEHVVSVIPRKAVRVVSQRDPRAVTSNFGAIVTLDSGDKLSVTDSYDEIRAGLQLALRRERRAPTQEPTRLEEAKVERAEASLPPKRTVKPKPE